MPIQRIKVKRVADSKGNFEAIHGVSLAEVAARAAFPPRVPDPKKDLPTLTVIEESNVSPVDNTQAIEPGSAFHFEGAAPADLSGV